MSKASKINTNVGAKVVDPRFGFGVVIPKPKGVRAKATVLVRFTRNNTEQFVAIDGLRQAHPQQIG